MNKVFPSDTNEGTTIALHGNKIVLVSGNSSEWSQDQEYEDTKGMRAAGNVIDDMIESNSHEMEDEEPLNAKNVMMISEDSSEWSKDFIGGGNSHEPLTEIHETKAVLIETSQDSEEFQENEQETQTGHNSGAEDQNELSNLGPDAEELEGKNSVEQSQEEPLNGDLLRCRTCLCIVDPEDNLPLYTPQPSGETLKDLLIYLLPQMVSTVCEEDVVCKQCDTSIKFCVDFIDNCLRVENELLSEYDEQLLEGQEDSMEAERKFKPDEPSHVSLDHNYIVGQAKKSQIKSEVLMDTDENMLSSDPTLASTEEYLFECYRCGETFESENLLDNHAKVEHGILKEINNEPTNPEERIYYKCNVCEVLFATKTSYYSHVKTSHPELETQSPKQGAYTCKQCGNKFFYLADLFEHKRNVHGFACTVCPERFDIKKDFESHMESHPDLYFCEICNKGFKTRKSLSSHVLEHDDPSLNLCEECGRNFNSPEELAVHLEQGIHPVEKLIKTFICNLCDASFTDRRRLNKHKKVYHECVREYLCTLCDKNFSSKTSLDSHYKLKHAEVKPYQCERCGERFARLDYLRRHNNCSEQPKCRKFTKGPRRKFRYTKIDGEPVKCKLCGKVFKDVYLLKLHLTTHTNLRKFRCSICNMTFTTNKNRERHEKIHEDPLNKYRCAVCWKRTQNQEELDEHMMSHEKKYQCHVCHESFARVYLLNYHVSEEHADDEDLEKEKQIVFTEGLKEYLLEY